MRHPNRWGRRTGLIAALLVTGLGSLVNVQAQTVRMEGSDLLDQGVVAVLEARAAEMGREVKTNFKGSRPAKDMLMAGLADIALIVERTDAEPWEGDWAAVTLGYFTTLVVASESLPLEQLSIADLARIFSSNSAVASSRWGEFGAPGVWGSVPITGYVTLPTEGLSQVLFEYYVMKQAAFKGSIKRYETTDETVKTMLDDDGGLAIVPWVPANSSESKVLLLAARSDEVAFGPTPQNIHAGDYPLRAPIRLVFARAQAPELLDWLRFWYSDEMREALAAVGVVSLPVAARNQQVFELEVIR
jgi:ABC-type phosphate transport system substrate-binding protein